MSDLPKTRAQLARYIDHTALKAETTRAQIDKLCDECLAHNFAAACVNPYWVAHCADRLAHGETAVATVVGFPLGASATEVKAFETVTAIEQGAREIDMVVNLGALLDGDRDLVTRDIRGVVESARGADRSAIVKVILETAALNEQQIALGCACCVDAGADYVKTSTGFHAGGGATVETVALLREHAPGLKVKAAGGIRDLPTALGMIEAGADRLGASAGVAIVGALDT